MENNSAGQAQATITLERTFNASIDRVFAAWTNATFLSQWFGPSGFTVSGTEVDLREGGKYRIFMQSPEGNSVEHGGEYVNIDVPVLLVFTWVLAGQECVGCEGQNTVTLVTINFLAIDQFSTHVTLVHEKLPDAVAYDGHLFGWTSSLDELGKWLEA